VDWLNLHISTLDSEDFLGCEPVDQATWLKLLRYCIGQENGGIIQTGPEWGDRRWQQVFRVTIKEVRRECALWSWNGNALHVHFYPVDKEIEVKQNRQNGRRGGRPRNQVDNHPVNHPVNQSGTGRFDSAETEGKGKERKGKEGNPTAAAPPSESPFDEPHQAAPAPPQMEKHFQDWRIMVGRRVGINDESSSEDAWKVLYGQAGWEIMSAMYAALSAKLKDPKHRVWLPDALAWIDRNTTP
jgi:hypothetical protein